ncbi:MAG: ATP-dependent helicase [Proteobacteria bacterium]|nr:ATP-dependent helicase [Pseudomonadota bacterium]MBU4294985.1 ATP-dependent helicase [Pseudomonadota bacterium]MCG2746663.1 ATP-dependent helicase [Desulfobulbaceae bacterium]
MNLTDEQQRIVAHQAGHAKVSAVAGSGKTTTMVARVRHLLEQGVAPQQMLVLMFNRSARDSFAAAMHDLLQPAGLSPPEVRTFHSLGLRLVGSFTRKKFLPAHTLVTEEYQLEKLAKSAVRRIIDQEDGSEEWLSGENLEGFLTFIDLVKSDILPAGKLFSSLQLAEGFSYFIEAFEIFEAQRQAAKIRSYADLIHEPVMAMLGNPQLADWAANHVDHIIVDEYQDINEVQQQLLKIIAGHRAQVMVVGDVDQCIYEWRGAKPEYITKRFARDFPHPATYTLSNTFRYGHRLSLAANHLIVNNRLRDRKLCLSFPTTPDTTLSCLQEKEPHPVLAILEELAAQGRSPAEAVVLVRMFAMSVPVELALLDAHIPYRLVGHEQVFACPEIKALSGYLHLCQGSLGEIEPSARPDIIEAMLTHPHLGVKREKISELAAHIAGRPERAIERILAAPSSDTPHFVQKRFTQTAETWHEIGMLPSSAKAGQILETVIKKTNLFDFYRNISSRIATAENRIKTCQAFVRFAQRLNLAVAPFLEKIGALQQQAAAPAGDCLLITSIHRAKGLEWPVVIIPGLTDGSFPLISDDHEITFDNLEDERRLFYVAMTRARQQVFFIHPPDSRFSKMKKAGNGRYPQPKVEDGFPASRFLYEANLGLSNQLGDAVWQGEGYSGKTIIAQDIEVANQYLAAINSPVKPVQQPEKPASTPAGSKKILSINELAEGLLVRHHSFGPGVVTAVLDRRQGKVRVLFDHHGEKTLKVEIARLQPQ